MKQVVRAQYRAVIKAGTTEEQLKEVPTEELPMSFSSESFKDILDKIKKGAYYLIHTKQIGKQ